MRLTGKVAIVTGASRGIGRAIACALGGEGATVVLTGRSQEALAETADLVAAAGGRGQVIAAELTDEDSIIGLVRAVIADFGGIDILVNNAGITHSASIADTDTQAWDRCMAVNARAPFILCREAVAALLKAEQGFIVNISSVVGIKGYPLQGAYTASKHAMRGMTMSLAEELRDTNVRVHLLCPGAVDTEMVASVRPDIAKDDLIAPDELAEMVVYLVTHKGNAVIDELRIRRAASAPWF